MPSLGEGKDERHGERCKRPHEEGTELGLEEGGGDFDWKEEEEENNRCGERIKNMWTLYV